MAYLLISIYVNFPLGFHKQLLVFTFKVPHCPCSSLMLMGRCQWHGYNQVHHCPELTKIGPEEVAGKGWTDPLQHSTSPGNRWCLHLSSNGRTGRGDGRMVMLRTRCLHRTHEALRQKRCSSQEGTLKEEIHKPLPKPSSSPEELPHAEYIQWN